MNTKKIIAVCLSLSFIAVLCGAYFADRTVITANFSTLEKMTVVIDAGHGGIDGGVTGVDTGVKESDLNLAIANALAENFRAGGFTVVMTRTNAGGLYGALTKGFKMRDMESAKR